MATQNEKVQNAKKAVECLAQQLKCTDDEVLAYRENTRRRYPTERWLDENEREWYALDKLMRSRAWATKKDTPFPYPFRKATNEMRKVEGPWIGDDEYFDKPSTRGKAPSQILTQIKMPAEFPPTHRVLLFTPEFGSEHSYDKEAWKALMPEESTDIWVVCWQGWLNFDDMLSEVTRAALSFADGVNTVWFGHSMGAIVAFEVLKRFEGLECPCLPVALVASGCPAPKLFVKEYTPYNKYEWLTQISSLGDVARLDQQKRDVLSRQFRVEFDKQGRVELNEARLKSMIPELNMMKEYTSDAKDEKKVHIPIVAICHDEDELVARDAIEAWAECTDCDSNEVPAFELFALEDEDDGEVLADLGHGFASDPTDTLIEKVSATMQKHNNEKDVLKRIAKIDVGPTDGPLPEKVDFLTIGAGIGGIGNSDILAKSGKSIIIIEREKRLGGIWQMYANVYSRVNSSEILYRVINRQGATARANEDHTPSTDILSDLYLLASQRCKGCFRTQREAKKVEKCQDGTYDATILDLRDNTTHKVNAGAVTFTVNRRIGKRRDVTYNDENHFRGEIVYGYANEVRGTKFWGKKTMIVGAGAFAFENVRTALELGAKHVYLLGRRAGTTCPKWIDMISILRPTDAYYNTNKTGNMISFETWKQCYSDAGLALPDCWSEGLLKPNNHTVSVADMAFIAGYHGMVTLLVGEIKKFNKDGYGVELMDGSTIELDVVVKCTGFHRNTDVPDMVGKAKSYPWGALDLNMQYAAEPLLDGGQFGSAKGGTDVSYDESETVTDEAVKEGFAAYMKLGLPDIMTPRANAFGSGYACGMRSGAEFFKWLVEHQDQQKGLIESIGAPTNDCTELWLSTIGKGMFEASRRILAALKDADALEDK